MRAFKAAFGITSGLGLGVLVVVLAVALTWNVGLGISRHTQATETEVRCQQASTALASGDRAQAVRTFLGGKLDEELLFDLASQLAAATSPAPAP
jgi:hypothetical protein